MVRTHWKGSISFLNEGNTWFTPRDTSSQAPRRKRKNFFPSLTVKQDVWEGRNTLLITEDCTKLRLNLNSPSHLFSDEGEGNSRHAYLNS